MYVLGMSLFTLFALQDNLSPHASPVLTTPHATVGGKDRDGSLAFLGCLARGGSLKLFGSLTRGGSLNRLLEMLVNLARGGSLGLIGSVKLGGLLDRLLEISLEMLGSFAHGGFARAARQLYTRRLA
jgi:hypothetical protein